MGVCDDIQKLVASFWWGSKRDGRNIHWARWEKMCQAKCRGGMGFRDFSSFNRALLAKQGWRIQQAPDSLVARILKARYFPSQSFLDAKLGSKPSYIWRSILWGRKVICSGSRWRVGNGQKIHIIGANWIPQPSTFQPVFTPSLPPDALVSDLINEANCWDERKIFEHFHKMDAEMIAKIPLPRSPREDELIWHYGKHGQFSVRSGYQTALHLKFPAMPSSSVVSNNEWNIIWSLALPQKIRIFVWRAAHNQLPSAENLWKRKIIQDPTCQVCHMATETVFHALVGCKSVEKIWKLIHIAPDIHAAHSHDILSLLHALKTMRSRDDLELIATIFWAKWYARNQLLFKGKRENPQFLVAKAEALVAAYKKVHCPAGICSTPEQRATSQKWKPPPAGFVTVNIDAAVSSEKSMVGLGAVIRDEMGQVRAAAVKVSKLQGDVSYAEAEAMEWGLLVAADADMRAVIVESDSQGVVNLVNNKQGSRSEIYWVLSEIQRLAQNFERISFHYIPRSCNAIAHSLAKLALENCETVVWKDSYPSQVMNCFLL